MHSRLHSLYSRYALINTGRRLVNAGRRRRHGEMLFHEESTEKLIAAARKASQFVIPRPEPDKI